MLFYRGTSLGPTSSEMRDGFTNYPKYKAPSGGLYAWFLERVKELKTVNDLAFNWRGETPGGLIATAMTEAGAYDHMAHVYRVEYADADIFCFEMEKSGAIKGGGFKQGEGVNLPADRRLLLLTDSQTPADASVVALYHGQVGTREVTFLNAIPRANITGHRGGKDTAGTFAALT